jgi:hypothetical protein
MASKQLQVIDWVQVGTVNVDTGLIWIGDPGYCVTPDANQHPAPSWREFCDRFAEDEWQHKQWNHKAGHPGLGVTVQSGYGDGTYPVLIRKNTKGVIVEVKIVFEERGEDTDQ